MHLFLRKQKSFWNPHAHPKQALPLSHWACLQVYSSPGKGNGVTMTGSYSYNILPGLGAAEPPLKPMSTHHGSVSKKKEAGKQLEWPLMAVI